MEVADFSERVETAIGISPPPVLRRPQCAAMRYVEGCCRGQETFAFLFRDPGECFILNGLKRKEGATSIIRVEFDLILKMEVVTRNFTADR